MVSDSLLRQYYELKKMEAERKRTRKLFEMYPDKGQFRRELYPKHLSFFRQKAKSRVFLAANRTGKTISGSYEMACHLTGLYPDWWEGKRFDHPVDAWCAGVTNTSTRDIIQKELFGLVSGASNGKKWVSGEGMIPLHCIEEIRWKSGLQDAIDYAIIRHKTGGQSVVGFKSYEQGRTSFEGTAKHVIWLDEEPPQEVFSEASTRTATTKGIIFLTFTPLKGVSDVIKGFLPDGGAYEYNDGIKSVTTMTWDDAPHLDEETKQSLIAGYAPHERDARTRGEPSLGAGAVYPVAESQIFIDDFEVPIYWPRAFGMDVGWSWNAGIWGAIDRDKQTVYIYSEAKVGQVEPASFVQNMRARGSWMQGVIDTAAHGANSFDGRDLMTEYQKLGLKIYNADKSVEAGIFHVYNLMVSGRLKIFNSCVETKKEFRNYMRDEKGKIKKKNDHCFHGDTEVITDKGVMKIEDMVGTTGKVLSLDGEMMPYENCRMTKRSAETVVLTFEDGYQVKCTPDHLFLTGEGWEKAIDLMDVFVKKQCAKNAQTYAELKCTKIETAENCDVYCMNVPVTHAFSLGNGLIVHNCMDAMRYLLFSGLDYATINPEAYRNPMSGKIERPRHIHSDFNPLDY
ncbi:large terminase protein [Caudoviricetes sp.]|nr:large terminase protein [Caudoviricetes sp.]